jgi:glutathione synthase/RimK-type ligase-like ATP-grasp enzyme
MRVQVGGAGGAPSNNFIRSLRDLGDEYYVIGMCASPSDLFLADVPEKYLVPSASDPRYRDAIVRLLQKTKPDLLHLQNDFEVRAISRMRDDVTAQNVRLFLPNAQTVEDCVDKMKSYAIWEKAGVPVPTTVLVDNPEDLRSAFRDLGPKVWVRATEGGGGTGALPTDDYEFARLWIERYNGWGHFTASECLTERTVTWLSIWHEGELVVAQTRRRHSWNFGNRTLSGVTGITGVGETCSEPAVDELAQNAIAAIDAKPHGLYGVDMTYDDAGNPRVTEINIGRFFTTHYFFTHAGLNMPDIYSRLAITGEMPKLAKKINPLPDGLIWIRGMDVEPAMTTSAELERVAREIFLG